MSEPGNGKKVALMASEAARRDDQDEDGPDIFVLKHESSIFRSFIQPCMWFGSAKPVLRGTNSTQPNLFHHGETTYRVG